MFKNYLKIAWRNIVKNKLFSAINIVGLGLAIPFALLSLMQVQSVFEYDNFHPNSERLYRIITDVTTANGDQERYASSPFLLADKLKTSYAGIEKATTIVRNNTWEMSNRIKTLELNTLYVQPTFFDLFGFYLAAGSLPVQANTLVLSHEMARRFFGDSNPVGKTLTHPDLGLFTITGVLKPFKKETHLRSDALLSMATFVKHNPGRQNPKSWADYDSFTFVRLQPKTAPTALDRAVAAVSVQTNPSIAFAKQTHQFRKQSLSAISPDFDELKNNPYVESLRDLSVNLGIALVIILLAAFNYTNLSLARSLSRAKEVGIRKVSGAVRTQVIGQFIFETILIALVALVLGFGITQVMKQTIHVGWIVWEVENQVALWLLFVGFTVLVGFLAGIFPALILSGFQPATVLKGTIGPRTFGKIGFRRGLVVTQFVVTTAFIFLIGHMYSQFTYMATENENFNRRNILNLTLTGTNAKSMLADMSRHKHVQRIGLTSAPFGGMAAQCAIKAKPTDEAMAAYYYAVNRPFIENMNLTWVAGQNLPNSEADSAGSFVVLNERAVRRLGFSSPQDAIGQTILLNNRPDRRVVGVVKDFCYANYQFSVEPLVFQYNPAQFTVASIRTSDGVDEAVFLADMQAVWKKYMPYQPFVYAWYARELYERYFPGEDMKFLGMVSVIIFVIAMLGLLGIVTYTTEKRVKEIGIRKVMGASVWEITRLISWSFLKLLLIAGLIALPIGYATGLLFVRLFTFHAEVNVGLMTLGFSTIFMIALLTIGWQSIKAALMNPVKSLRSE